MRAALLVAAVACALSGCSSARDRAAAPTRPGPGAARPSPVDIAQAPVVAGAAGLELHTWRVAESSDALNEALRPYAEADGALDGATRERWRLCGLRAVSVPVADVAKVFAAVGMRGALDRRWLGQPVEWTAVRVGGPLNGRGGVRVDDGVATLGAGRLRLLVRAWAAPTPEGPRLRVELATQHVGVAQAASFEQPRARDALREGVVISGLSARMALDGETAIVLIAEEPERRWGGGADDADRAPERPDSRTEAYGPRPALPPTAGEALLSDQESVAEGVRERTVLVLVARPPASFRLLP